MPGHYRVEVDFAGFQTFIQTSLVLEVGQTLAVDVTLDVGKQTDAVDVVGSAPVLDTQTSTVAQTVTAIIVGVRRTPNHPRTSIRVAAAS